MYGLAVDPKTLHPCVIMLDDSQRKRTSHARCMLGLVMSKPNHCILSIDLRHLQGLLVRPSTLEEEVHGLIRRDLTLNC